MNTLLLHIKPEKQDWFLNLLKEFDFITDVSVFESDLQLVQDQLIEESEQDIMEGKVTPLQDFEKEVAKWKKKQ